jgi:hypothetical protein
VVKWRSDRKYMGEGVRRRERGRRGDGRGREGGMGVRERCRKVRSRYSTVQYSTT